MCFCYFVMFVSLIRNRICNFLPKPGGRKVARFFVREVKAVPQGRPNTDECVSAKPGAKAVLFTEVAKNSP